LSPVRAVGVERGDRRVESLDDGAADRHDVLALDFDRLPLAVDDPVDLRKRLLGR
jgi:hypothetical protein